MENQASNKGSGTKILFIHGFLESKSMWNYLPIDELGECLCLELPGHGNQALWKSDDANLDHCFHSIQSQLDEQDFEPDVVVGHSLGGYVALNWSSQTNFQGEVVLLNSNFWTDSDLKKRDRNRVIDIVSKNKDIFIREAIPSLFWKRDHIETEIQELIEEAKGISAESIQSATAAMRDRNDFTEYCRQIKNRLTIIQGEHDQSTKLDDMLEKANGLSVNVINECGHMSHLEQPMDVIQILGDVVKGRPNS